MEKKGLCSTCTQFETCIFSKEPPIWQCEEFSDHVPGLKKSRPLTIKKTSSCEEETEAE